MVVAKVDEFGGGRGAVKAAAAFFGVTSAAISYHLSKADRNLMALRPSDERLREVWEQTTGDLSDVCALLGCSEQSARRWLGPEDMGLFAPRGYNEWTGEEMQQLAHYVRERNTTGRAGFAAQFERHSEQSVYRMASKLIDLGSPSDARPWRQTVSALPNSELRAYLTELDASPLTATEWQRANGYPNSLIETIRERLPSEWEKSKNAALARDGRTTVHIGKDFELGVLRDLRKRFKSRFGLNDWDNNSSHGAADLVVAANGRVYAIQCESNSSGKRRLDPMKWNRVYAWATLHNAVPLYCRSGPSGPIYLCMTGMKSGSKQEREPVVPFDWESDLLKREQQMTPLERELAELARPPSKSSRAGDITL